MAEVSTRELAELIGGVPLDQPHALICRTAAERLLEQERQLLESARLLWAAVRAAGGKVEIPNHLMVDAPSGFLHTRGDPALPGRVIEANFDA